MCNCTLPLKSLGTVILFIYLFLEKNKTFIQHGYIKLI